MAGATCWLPKSAKAWGRGRLLRSHPHCPPAVGEPGTWRVDPLDGQQYYYVEAMAHALPRVAYAVPGCDSPRSAPANPSRVRHSGLLGRRRPPPPPSTGLVQDHRQPRVRRPPTHSGPSAEAVNSLIPPADCAGRRNWPWSPLPESKASPPPGGGFSSVSAPRLCPVAPLGRRRSVAHRGRGANGSSAIGSISISSARFVRPPRSVPCSHPHSRSIVPECLPPASPTTASMSFLDRIDDLACCSGSMPVRR